ncbi:MAG: hypothetical protein CMC90_03645 [Flavobacteriaceae bacterium]|nr:hypothetical protein [Flavobacteriaceae bacterium]
MISNQEISSLVVLIVFLAFFFFQIFQKVKLIYLFRSVNYHFRNIFIRYNPDDIGISSSGTFLINYFHYFYIFFYFLINGVIISYLTTLNLGGIINIGFISNNLILSLIYSFSIIFSTILIRFFIIKIFLEIFFNYRLKFIFFKNYIINIIIGVLMLINLIIYNLNSFYNIDYLKNTLFILIVLHIIFQTKNYLSYFLKSNLKEVMYFILYLCAFKLAPWIWLYSIFYI